MNLMSSTETNETKNISEKLISIVVPIYNEEFLVRGLVKTIFSVIEADKTLNGYNFEVVLVNDGSYDNSWKEIESMADDMKASNGSRIRGISFSRNFGKESAIMAGLACAEGVAVITMDADMQHPPSKIPEFVKSWENGAKVVEGIKTNRGNENPIYGLLSNGFYGLMSKAIGKDLSNTSDYKLLDRTVVDVILRMPERQMFFRAITSWCGFRTATVGYEVQERCAGTSKWSAIDLFFYAVRNLTSFSTAPLHIITICAMLFFALGIFGGLFTIFKWLNGTAVEGFTTVILLQLLQGGIVMLALGLIGCYLSKLFDEARHRPRYIIEKTTDRGKNDD